MYKVHPNHPVLSVFHRLWVSYNVIHQSGVTPKILDFLKGGSVIYGNRGEDAQEVKQ